MYDLNLTNLLRRFEQKKDDIRSGIRDAVIDGVFITLNDWFDEWYKNYKAPTLKDGGSAAYVRQYKNYYGCRIGTKPLKDLRQVHVQTAIADMLESGRSAKSVREATGILRNCVEAAIANGFMRLNPVLGTQIPHCSKAERRVLSTVEQKEFLAYLESNNRWFRELYEFMLVTGVRVGEAGGLQWEDIDFEGKFIYIRRTLTYFYEEGKKTVKFSSPKTDNSVRKIPFFGETEDILRRQLKKTTARKKELGKKRWKCPSEFGNLVFVTSQGAPVGRYSVQSDMRHITAELNAINEGEVVFGKAIPMKFEPIHPHCLRHTFATRCFEKGMSPRTVQEIMGHVNYSTTASYTHVLDDIKLQEANRVGSFLDNTNNRPQINMNTMIGIM